MLVVVALAVASQPARADKPYAPGFLKSKKAYVLTVQYKQMPPAIYDVPLDMSGEGDVCAMRETSAGQSSGYHVSGKDGVRFSILRHPGDQYEIKFRARKLLANPPGPPQPQISSGPPPADSLQSAGDWEGTLAIDPGQTVALPLAGADWHATVMRVADPAPVAVGTEGNDPCWGG